MDYLRIIACAGMLAAAVQSQAQPQQSRPQGQPQRNEIRPPVSAEDAATRKTGILRSELSLTDKQYKKVYKLYLKQAEQATAPISSQGKPMAQGMGGPRPGGVRPGGGGMGGPGGGMGGPGGGMGGPGGGMGPGGGHGPGQTGLQPRSDEPYFEAEKEIAARDKKMKRILSADQYAKWKPWEQRDLGAQMDRSWGRPHA